MKKICISGRVYKVSNDDFRFIRKQLGRSARAMAELSIAARLRGKSYELLDAVCTFTYTDIEGAAEQGAPDKTRKRCSWCGCLLSDAAPPDATGHYHCAKHENGVLSAPNEFYSSEGISVQSDGNNAVEAKQTIK